MPTAKDSTDTPMEEDTSPSKLGTIAVPDDTGKGTVGAVSASASVVSALSSDLTEADVRVLLDMEKKYKAMDRENADLKRKNEALIKVNAAMSRNMVRDEENRKNCSTQGVRTDKEMEAIVGGKDVLNILMAHALYFKGRFWSEVKTMPRNWQKYDMENDRTVCYEMMERFKGVYPRNYPPQMIWVKFMVPLLTSQMHEWRTRSFKKMADQIFVCKKILFVIIDALHDMD